MKIIFLSFTLFFLLSSCSDEQGKSEADGQTKNGNTKTTKQTATQEYPLYLTTMTHMESNFKDDTDEVLFLLHVKQLRYAMDLAEEYEAILTIESEKSFARANETWGLNIMQEILDRGHGVGTHCDIGWGKTTKSITAEEYSLEFTENKALVDALVGSENNHGCSGGGSSNDWVTAASLAGFDYINGIVGMHVYAIDQKNRPNPEWDDRFIEKEAYHNNVPEDLEDRIYLMQLKDLEDFEGDEEGIVISNGELGRLDALAEGGEDCPKSGCSFTTEDTDAFVELIKEVDGYRDASRVAKLALYFPVNTFDEKNEEALRYFFSEAQKLQEGGLLEWASQWEVVETYLEANH